VETLNVKPGGTYSGHWAFESSKLIRGSASLEQRNCEVFSCVTKLKLQPARNRHEQDKTFHISDTEEITTKGKNVINIIYIHTYIYQETPLFQGSCSLLKYNE